MDKSSKCRICLKSGVHKSKIFPRYAFLIHMQTTLAISRMETAPDVICIDCISCVMHFVKFKEQCINSEIYWTNEAKQNEYLEVISEEFLNEELVESAIDIETIEQPDDYEFSNVDIGMIEKPEPSPVKKIAIKQKRGLKGMPGGLCPHCGQYKIRLNDHIKRHGVNDKKNFKCNECNASFGEKSYLTRHRNIHTKALQYPCSICARVFHHPGSLKSHLVTHSEEFKFSCDLCGKQFKHRSNWRDHKNYTHLNIKKAQCDVCHKMFADQTRVRMHMRSHTNFRPYECQICSHRFTKPNNLKMHMITHTKAKNYECPHCDNAFSYNVTRINHIKKVHPEML